MSEAGKGWKQHLSMMAKYTLTFAVPWTLAIFISLAWNWFQVLAGARESASVAARTEFAKDVIYRRWNAGHGGVYAPISEKTQPNPYLEVSERDIETPSGRRLTLVNPAYMTRQVHELGWETEGVRGHITSLNPIRPANAPDDWEKQALASFERGNKEFASIETLAAEDHLRLMRPLITEKGCLKCHAKQGYKVGDVRGGISVSRPMAPFVAIARQNMLGILLGHLGLWLLGLGGIGFGAARIERQRNRAKEALQRREDYLRTVLESTADGILAVDTKGNIRHTNHRFAELWRIPRELLESGQDAQLLKFVVDQLTDPEAFLAKVEQLYGSAEASSDTLIFKDGRVFERFSCPLTDNGALDGRVWSFRDITEGQQAGAELRQLRNYLSNIIDSMPSALVGVDLNGTVTQYNNEAERLTGVRSADAAGQPLGRVFPRLAAEMDRVREAVRARQVLTDARRVWQDNGETRYEDLTIFPLIANDVEGAVIRLDDVTERVRIEEMMVQSEKMVSVGGLAAGMAHEINNPLAGMIQTASVMSARLTDPELPANRRAAEEAGTTVKAISAFMESRGVLRMLERIQESGKRAAEIVSNMLSFARMSDATFAPHNLAELLDQCVDLAGSDYNLKQKHDFRQIEIVREYPENIPDVICEGGKIRQVLLNILRNGAEAMQAGAGQPAAKKPRFTLRLAHEQEADRVCLEIEDNGPGMDEATRKRVFEPFFTTKPTDQGTGLGLSVSYFIISQTHGGEMSVESTIEQGTKFAIRLPVQRRKQ